LDFRLVQIGNRSRYFSGSINNGSLIYLTSLIVVLALTIANPASADLVGWWRFDDGSGTTAMDSSGNGNDGTLNGGAQWTDGQIGSAIQFNGTDSSVTAPYIPLNTQSRCGLIRICTPISK
jgi:hypothetical protein